ncbi:hypothetical protein JAAARDRAFT_38495, partial [Jaapia argillacea MUCL 33604]
MFTLCTVQALLDLAIALYTPEIIAHSVCIGDVCLGCDGETESRVNQINIQSLLSMIYDAVMTVNQLMADGLLIYRTFVLWRSSIRIIVIPIATLIGTAVCGFFQASLTFKRYTIRRNAPLDETTPPPEWVALTDLGYTLNTIQDVLITTTSVLTTVLIVSRIWWITQGLHRTLGRRATRKYHRIVKMIVESGGVYTMWLLIRLIFIYIYRDDFSDIPAVVGITPTLLIVMLGLGESVDRTTFPCSNVVNIVPPVSEPLEVGSPVPLSDSYGVEYHSV